MSTTTLDPSFLRAVVLMTSFKPEPMKRAQAALLIIALEGLDFTAADLPGEVAGDNVHLAGAATGALVAQGLLNVVGRVKSPRLNAKGRKLDVLRLAKRETARTWLQANGFEVPAERQREMAL